jgi:hypothetical protein
MRVQDCPPSRCWASFRDCARLGADCAVWIAVKGWLFVAPPGNDASETALHSKVLQLYVAGQLGNRIGSPQSKPTLRHSRSIRTVDMKTRTENTRGPRGLTASVILLLDAYIPPPAFAAVGASISKQCDADIRYFPVTLKLLS